MTSPLPSADVGVADMSTMKLTSSPALRFRNGSAAGVTEETKPPSSDRTMSAAWAYTALLCTANGTMMAGKVGGNRGPWTVNGTGVAVRLQRIKERCNREEVFMGCLIRTRTRADWWEHLRFLTFINRLSSRPVRPIPTLIRCKHGRNAKIRYSALAYSPCPRYTPVVDPLYTASRQPVSLTKKSHAV